MKTNTELNLKKEHKRWEQIALELDLWIKTNSPVHAEWDAKVSEYNAAVVKVKCLSDRIHRPDKKLPEVETYSLPKFNKN